MDVREIVESITREILQAMKGEQAARPKVLFIFCDSTAQEAFTNQFIKLKNHGIFHDILFLDGETSSWLGMHRIECGGAGKIIAADEYAPAPLEVPKEYDAIVMPEIDLDNAARVAAGMKGSIKAELIFSALVLAKPVIIGEDVPGLKRSDRRCLQTLTLPVPYQRLFERHRSEMKELGIHFAPQKDLADLVIQKLVPAEQLSGQTPLFPGKLLTADWVKARAGDLGKTIVLQPGCIVSPLAYDVLKEKGISVHYLGKG
jgi:hypothetical protein